MSFDPINIALAKPTVIDLDTYEFVVGNNSVSLGAFVFAMYMEAASKGAVRYDVPDSIEPLWEALSNSTNRPIRVKLSTTALGMPYTVQSDEVTVIYHETAGAVTMSFNFMMYFSNMLSVVKVAVNYGGATTNVFVSVEPVDAQPMT